MRLPPRALLYAGIGAVVVGLAAFVYTWGRVAGLTSVPLQLPYLVSGGFTGLAFVLIGLTLVNVHVKLDEATERSRQLDRVADLLVELRGGEVPADTTGFARPDEDEATADETAEIDRQASEPATA